MSDDLDAELLAMAGSDSSDEEEEVNRTQHIDDRSPTPEAPVKASVEDDNGPRRGVAQKIKPRRGRKVVRRRESSDEEDGEA
jgi:RNA polymerase-associated protein RTF1